MPLIQVGYQASKGWFCPFKCNESFRNEKGLRDHLNLNEDHSQCDKCEEWFENWDAMLQHKVQSKNKDHLCCPICGKNLNSIGGLERHVTQSHQTRQEIPCAGCGETFVRAGAMMDHLEKGKCAGFTKDVVRDHLAHQAIVERVLKIPTRQTTLEMQKAEGNGSDDGGVRVNVDALVESTKDGPRTESVLQSTAAPSTVSESVSKETTTKAPAFGLVDTEWLSLSASKHNPERRRMLHMNPSPSSSTVPGDIDSANITKITDYDAHFREKLGKLTLTKSGFEIRKMPATTSPLRKGVTGATNFASATNTEPSPTPSSVPPTPTEITPARPSPGVAPRSSGITKNGSSSTGKIGRTGRISSTESNQPMSPRDENLPAAPGQKLSNNPTQITHPRQFASGLAQLDENYRRAKSGDDSPAPPILANNIPFNASTKFWDPETRNFNIELFFNANSEKYECPLPGCTFEAPANEPWLLEHHLSSRAHHSIRQFRCPACKRVFKTSTALVQHCESPADKCKIRHAQGYDKFIRDLSGGFLTVVQADEKDEGGEEGDEDEDWNKSLEKLRKERTYGMEKPKGFW